MRSLIESFQEFACMQDKIKKNKFISSAVEKSNIILWIDIIKDVRDALLTSTDVIEDL